MKKIIISLFCLLSLSACQPPHVSQQVQQQHFICKALIEGFLKTQNLTDYQFLSLAPSLTETSTQRTYQYRLNNEREMQMNLKRQKNLQFQCDQSSAENFKISLAGEGDAMLSLIQLDLPKASTLEMLSAYQQPSVLTHKKACIAGFFVFKINVRQLVNGQECLLVPAIDFSFFAAFDRVVVGQTYSQTSVVSTPQG